MHAYLSDDAEIALAAHGIVSISDHRGALVASDSDRVTRRMCGC